MAKITDKRALFESVPVTRAIWTMAIPTIISQLINLVYNTVDAIFIGQAGNAYMVAGVSLAFTVFMMTIAFANLFGIGGGSLIARLIGRREDGCAKAVSSFSFWGAVAIAALYTLLIWLFLEPILTFLGASDNTMLYAKQYVFCVIILGCIPLVLSLTTSHLLRNVGYATQASIGLSGGGILNIALDPLFMFVLLPRGNEVLGAAIATLLSNVCSCVYLLIVMARVSKNAPLSMNPARLKTIRKQDVSELFAVGIPSAILTGLFDVGNIFLNRLTAMHGDLEVAAMGIVMRAERLPNAVNIGLCQGMLPIVAYNYAAKNHERMRSVTRTARTMGLAVSLICVVLIEVFTEPIVEVFFSSNVGDPTAAAATLAFAVSFLNIRCLASPVQFLNYHSSYCLQAMGDGRGTLIHAICRILVFYVPMMYAFNAVFGMLGIVWALIASEALGAVVAIVLLRLWLRKQNAV